MRLTFEERRLIGEAVDRGNNKSTVAKVLGITRATVYKWDRRRSHLKDRKRCPKESKITADIEASILALRSFGWGTARIQQGLFCLPEYMRDVIPHCVQDVKLSRTAINNILQRHKLNGYLNEDKNWKFFRAKKPNELWQIDLKGPFIVQGKKYYFLACIDDYSRYFVVVGQLDFCPTTKDVCNLIQSQVDKFHPKSILADNGGQFKELWKKWCRENGVEPLSAHPYYPQDKGKVERSIRNLSQEFVYLLTKFPEWLNGTIQKYRDWYNEKRYHRGILAIPCTLFCV